MTTESFAPNLRVRIYLVYLSFDKYILGMPENIQHPVRFSWGTHGNKAVIWIEFEYNKELNDRLRKKFPKATWSQTRKAWCLNDTPANRVALQLPPKQPGATILNRIHPVNHPALKRFVETLQLKAYSPETIRTYVNEFSQLLQLLKNHPVHE